MKKNRLILAAASAAMLVSLAACGSSKTAETTAAETAASTAAGETSTDGTATSSTVSADDPEVKALEEMTVPEKPTLENMGKIKLADLTAIEVTTTPKTEVTDADVQSQIDNALQSSLTEVDEAAKDGDTVNIDYVGTIDGKEFDGGSSTGYDLKLGSNSFIDGFETQLVGHKKGDKVDVNVTFPSDYSNADLQGKAAVFAVTVNSVKRASELTDDWVKNSSGTTAATVAEYRQQIKARLEANSDYQYHSGIQQSALEKAVDGSEIMISDDLKNYAEAYVISSQLSQMKQYGYGLADMLNMYGMSVSDFKDEMESSAADYAKQMFVIQQIANDQNITSNDDLITKLAENMSELSGKDYNKVKLIEQFGGDAVAQEAVNDAVLSYLESQVKVTEEAATTAAADAAETDAAESDSAETEAETSAAETSAAGSTAAETAK